MGASDKSSNGRWADHQAVVEIASPFDVKIEGADAICAWRAGSALLEFLMHTTFSPTVHFRDVDRATATSQTREMVRGPARVAGPDAHALNTVFYSVYYDDIVSANGAWRFARRRCRPIYLESGGLLGETLAPRSSLEQFTT